MSPISNNRASPLTVIGAHHEIIPEKERNDEKSENFQSSADAREKFLLSSSELELNQPEINVNNFDSHEQNDADILNAINEESNSAISSPAERTESDLTLTKQKDYHSEHSRTNQSDDVILSAQATEPMASDWSDINQSQHSNNLSVQTGSYQSFDPGSIPELDNNMIHGQTLKSETNSPNFADHNGLSHQKVKIADLNSKALDAELSSLTHENRNEKLAIYKVENDQLINQADVVSERKLNLEGSLIEFALPCDYRNTLDLNSADDEKAKAFNNEKCPEQSKHSNDTPLSLECDLSHNTSGDSASNVKTQNLISETALELNTDSYNVEQNEALGSEVIDKNEENSIAGSSSSSNEESKTSIIESQIGPVSLTNSYSPQNMGKTEQLERPESVHNIPPRLSGSIQSVGSLDKNNRLPDEQGSISTSSFGSPVNSAVIQFNSNKEVSKNEDAVIDWQPDNESSLRRPKNVALLNRRSLLTDSYSIDPDDQSRYPEFSEPSNPRSKTLSLYLDDPEGSQTFYDVNSDVKDGPQTLKEVSRSRSFSPQAEEKKRKGKTPVPKVVRSIGKAFQKFTGRKKNLKISQDDPEKENSGSISLLTYQQKKGSPNTTLRSEENETDQRSLDMKTKQDSVIDANEEITKFPADDMNDNLEAGVNKFEPGMNELEAAVNDLEQIQPPSDFASDSLSIKSSDAESDVNQKVTVAMPLNEENRSEPESKQPLDEPTAHDRIKSSPKKKAAPILPPPAKYRNHFGSSEDSDTSFEVEPDPKPMPRARKPNLQDAEINKIDPLNSTPLENIIDSPIDKTDDKSFTIEEDIILGEPRFSNVLEHSAPPPPGFNDSSNLDVSTFDEDVKQDIEEPSLSSSTADENDIKVGLKKDAKFVTSDSENEAISEAISLSAESSNNDIEEKTVDLSSEGESDCFDYALLLPPQKEPIEYVITPMVITAAEKNTVESFEQENLDELFFSTPEVTISSIPNFADMTKIKRLTIDSETEAEISVVQNEILENEVETKDLPGFLQEAPSSEESEGNLSKEEISTSSADDSLLVDGSDKFSYTFKVNEASDNDVSDVTQSTSNDDDNNDATMSESDTSTPSVTSYNVESEHQLLTAKNSSEVPDVIDEESIVFVSRTKKESVFDPPADFASNSPSDESFSSSSDRIEIAAEVAESSNSPLDEEIVSESEKVIETFSSPVVPIDFDKSDDLNLSSENEKRANELLNTSNLSLDDESKSEKAISESEKVTETFSSLVAPLEIDTNDNLSEFAEEVSQQSAVEVSTTIENENRSDSIKPISVDNEIDNIDDKDETISQKSESTDSYVEVTTQSSGTAVSIPFLGAQIENKTSSEIPESSGINLDNTQDSIPVDHSTPTGSQLELSSIDSESAIYLNRVSADSILDGILSNLGPDVNDQKADESDESTEKADEISANAEQLENFLEAHENSDDISDKADELENFLEPSEKPEETFENDEKIETILHELEKTDTDGSISFVEVSEKEEPASDKIEESSDQEENSQHGKLFSRQKSEEDSSAISEDMAEKENLEVISQQQQNLEDKLKSLNSFDFSEDENTNDVISHKLIDDEDECMAEVRESNRVLLAKQTSLDSMLVSARGVSNRLTLSDLHLSDCSSFHFFLSKYNLF